MFTGIIEELGKVKAVTTNTLTVSAEKIFDDLKIGDSVAVNGVCLTAESIENMSFTANVMPETFRRTALGTLKTGSPVNLERAMLAGGRFGGHIVTGHIDGVGTITKVQKEQNAVVFTISASDNILLYVIEKGSVALDGISLTVASFDSTSFSVSIIPHTLKNTVLSVKKVGEFVNIETDIIGKYTQKLINRPSKAHTIDLDFLAQHGF
jgi:riboflavin synthase